MTADRLRHRIPARGIARGMLAMQYDATGVLRDIDVPTLVVVGDHDSMTKREASELIRAGAPRARILTLTPAKHLGLIELHEKYAATGDEQREIVARLYFVDTGAEGSKFGHNMGSQKDESTMKGAIYGRALAALRCSAWFGDFIGVGKRRQRGNLPIYLVRTRRVHRDGTALNLPC